MKKYILLLVAFFTYSPISNARNSKPLSPYNSSIRFKQRSDGEKLKAIPDIIEDHFDNGTPSKDDYFQRGEIYLYNEDFRLAISDFEQVLKEDKYNLQSIVGLAEAHFRLGDTFAAKNYIEQAFSGMMPTFFSGPYYNPLWSKLYSIRAALREQSGDVKGATDDRKKIESLK